MLAHTDLQGLRPLKEHIIDVVNCFEFDVLEYNKACILLYETPEAVIDAFVEENISEH